MTAINLPNATQLVLRHPQQLDSPLLVIDPPDAESIRAIAALCPATFLIRDFATYRGADATGADCRFGPWQEEATVFSQVLLFLPKGKELLAMTLDMARAALKAGGTLWLVGGNHEGIRSAARPLTERIGPARKIESARHCSLLAASMQSEAEPFDPAAWEERWRLELPDHALTIASWPGVFGHGRLDEGTRRLLDCLHTPANGRVADIGCGAGVIGAILARRCAGCQVELSDSNALAVAAARQTIGANRIANARVYPSDVFSQMTGTFDLIVSNPPFHSHVKTDYRVHRQLIEGAKQHLRRGGILQLVVNRFLKVEPMLHETFGDYAIDAEDNKYRVYRATQP